MTSRTEALGPEPDVAVTPKPGKANGMGQRSPLLSGSGPTYHSSGEVSNSGSTQLGGTLIHALPCTFVACDPMDTAFCMQYEHEVCAKNPYYYPCSVTPEEFKYVGKEGHCMACNCGLPCCFVGLKRPDTLVNCATHFCWIKSRTQLPWGAEGDDIPESCLCAICFVRCFESDEFCCVPPPSNVSFKK